MRPYAAAALTHIFGSRIGYCSETLPSLVTVRRRCLALTVLGFGPPFRFMHLSLMFVGTLSVFTEWALHMILVKSVCEAPSGRVKNQDSSASTHPILLRFSCAKKFALLINSTVALII